MLIRRALLSVYDKTGIVDFALDLQKLGFELVSSGGTATELINADIPVTKVEDITGFPEMIHGRVKTLHPVIHAGILARQYSENEGADLAEIASHGIEPFGLIVVNLYPFESNPSVDLIDVGGPTMVRGAAKNYESVGIVIDPDQYDEIIAELTQTGDLSLVTRLALAVQAFDTTSSYDDQIAVWLDKRHGEMLDAVDSA